MILIIKKLSVLLILFSVLAVANEDSESLQVLLEQADSARNTQPARFNNLVAQLQANSARLSPTQKELLTLLKAYQHIMSGDWIAAEPVLRELNAHSHDPLIRFRGLYTLVNVLNGQKKWADALEVTNLVLKEAPSIVQIEHRQKAYLTVVVLYNMLKQHDLALNYISQLEKQLLSPQNQCHMRQLELEAIYQSLSLAELEPKFERAIVDCQSAGVSIVLNILRIYKSEKLIVERGSETTLEYLKPYLKEIADTKYPMLIAKAHNLVAEAYLKSGDYHAAGTHITQALDLVKMAPPIIAVDSYRVAYQLYEQQGNIEQAYKAYKQYAEIERLNQDELSIKMVAFQTVKRKSEQQQSQIELLNKQNELLTRTQELDQEEAKNFKLISALSVSLSVLIAIFGFRSWQVQKRLKALSQYDHLTHVYNRRHFTELAQEALKLSVVKGEQVSCILLDLDYFKSVNDNYGHAAGDWALKRVAQVVSNTIRGNDIFARLGGEEFVILLPGCDVDNALRVAEKCRQAIAEIDTTESGHTFNVTASFGITDSTLSSYSLDKLFCDADHAAYQSKDKGRNTITLYEASPEFS